MADSGYTLPVWVAAAAVAAVDQLDGRPFQSAVGLCLQPGVGDVTSIPVQAAARLSEGRALAMACCDPGELLDLTRGLPVWVEASWLDAWEDSGWLELVPGEGFGVLEATGEACLSSYARQLLEENLRPLVSRNRGLRLTVTFPGGRALAERTSNAAFGVVDGLALIGTQALVQKSAAPDQLAAARAELRKRVDSPSWRGELILVIGENGLDLAPRLGFPAELLLKSGNWIGPLLVAAAEAGVQRLLLFGYQGKLIKLAGGIFHTHHHLADGRLEILAAQAALLGLPLEQVQAIARASSVEEALAALGLQDAAAAQALARQVAGVVEQRSAQYLARHSTQPLQLGAVLFDRARQISACGPQGELLLKAFRA
ncbi:cobalt-precorrin-5B (C(1))-methyltransferase CbiD [Vulcanococcus sp.]|uniref:cobalt-precorrin-5B (C(1))-methyltransferase CbiD n=1 Tax=Vulcanococcus sp. TaxID=2856995 RepID=UPI003C0DEC05